MRPTPTATGLYEPTHGAPYLGRWSDPELEGADYVGMRVRGEEPVEDPADGCPGAWYRTAFVGSLIPYLRDEHGRGWRYSDPATPWQVRDAIDYYERERARCDVHQHNVEVEREQARRERDQKKTKLATLRGRR